MTRRFAAALVLTLLGFAAVSACTPDQIQLIAAHLHDPVAGAMTCHGQVDALWPASSRAWAHQIVNRESRGIATAQNRRSTAAGCFQLLSMHADLFTANGYSWADRYNPRANVLAALSLFQGSGRAPWA